MSLQAFDTMLAFAAAMLILSLFITAWVQFLSALLRLRSGNLEWGLQRLLEQVDPDGHLKQQRDELVKRVLLHPALSRDSTLFGQKAEAIKADELVKMLRQLATTKKTDEVTKAVNSWLSTVAPTDNPGELQAQVDAITAEAGKLFPQQTQALREAVERAIHSRDLLAQRVGLWFDSTMDRASERFTLQCRWLTVAGAGVVVLVMGVDSLWMLRQLNDKPQLREPLMAYVQDVQKDEGTKTSKACDATAGKPTAGDKAAATPDAAASAAQACVELRRQQLEAARKRLDQGVTPLLLPGWWAAAASSPASDAAGKTAAGSGGQKSGSAQAPKDGSAPATDIATYIAALEARWPGFFMSFVLLSLGAPFWFNVLKNLSSLRPLIASRSDSKAG